MSVAVHAAAFGAAAIRATSIHAATRTPVVEFPVQVDPEPSPPPPTVEAPPPAATFVVVKPAPVRHEAPQLRAIASMAPPPETLPPAEAPAALTSDDALPRFKLAVAPSPSGDGTLAKRAGGGTVGTKEEGVTIAPFDVTDVDVAARTTYRPNPEYPFAARGLAIEGKVELELIVSEAGALTSVRCVHRLGHGLDESAMNAVRQWRFVPAMKHGHAVAVRMPWSIEFRLAD